MIERVLLSVNLDTEFTVLFNMEERVLEGVVGPPAGPVVVGLEDPVALKAAELELLAVVVKDTEAGLVEELGEVELTKDDGKSVSVTVVAESGGLSGMIVKMSGIVEELRFCRAWVVLEDGAVLAELVGQLKSLRGVGEPTVFSLHLVGADQPH
jgi:hypothetical protein